jgi:hypothetical protein
MIVTSWNQSSQDQVEQAGKILKLYRTMLDIDQLVKEERDWNCRKDAIYDLVHFSRNQVDKTER